MGRNYKNEGPFFSAGTDFPQTPQADSPWTETIYDNRGRPVEVKMPHIENSVSSTTFTYSGLTSSATGPDGDQKTLEKDYLGRIIRVTEHGDTEQYHTEYSYNAAGDLLQLVDHQKNTTEVTYDTLGRKTSMNDPDLGSWEYTYDDRGNLKTQTDAKGQTVTYSYDELNRLVQKSYSNSDPSVHYYYDITSSPDGKGKLGRMNNGTVDTRYEYDSMGRVTKVTKKIAGDQERSTSSQYDLTGKLIRLTYPDGFYVNYSYYPGTGLLQTVTGSDSIEYAKYSSYTPQGTIGLVEHGNGTQTGYTYDPSSLKLLEIKTEDPREPLEMIVGHDPAPIVIQTQTYDYTPGGNINEATSDITTVTSMMNPLEYMYKKNSFGKNTHILSSVKEEGISHSFLHDENGNMVALPDFNEHNTIRGKLDISYNVENMPTRITTGAGTTVNFAYDGNGVRAKKSARNKTTTYYIGKHFEVTDDGGTTKYIFAGAIRLAMKTGSDIYYFHKNHLGSTTAVTDKDGTLVERIEYLPSGVQSFHSGRSVTKYLYTDQEYDEETGLYNYNARLYDPVLGRFITPDTIVQNFFDPQTLNRYTYVRNDPLSYIDPSGHFFSLIIAGAIFGAISAGIQSDWDFEATLVGAFIGGVSGGAGAWASAAVGGGIVGAMLGGAVAGATAGGMGASYYGGNIVSSMVSGAALGMIGGAAFGGIGEISKLHKWGAIRTGVARAVASGGVAEFGGGDFRHGFTLSAGSSMLMFGWRAARNWTDMSSLSGDGKHRFVNGKLLTAGTRACKGVGCGDEYQNWFTKAGMGEEGAEFNKLIVKYTPASPLGQFIENTSKIHDWFNGLGYKGTGNYIAGSQFYNTAFQAYSLMGMVPASIVTGAAFSSTVYQPILY